MKKITIKRKYLAFPYAVFMLLFVILPLALIVFYAFTNADGSISLENFANFFTDGVAFNSFLDSIWIAFVTTLICFVVGFPVAYILANKKYNKNKTLFMLFLLPMWINFLLRTIATRAMFEAFGSWFNQEITFGKATTIFGMVYNFLPFMIIPIYSTLTSLDKSYTEAALDLGATPTKVITKVILPLALPGIISGITMVFMPTLSTFVISDLLGNNLVQLLGNIINLEFTQNSWNYGSALSIILLLLMGITMLIEKKYNSKNQTAGGRIW